MKKQQLFQQTELSKIIHINHRVGKVIDLNPSRIQTKEVTPMEECNISGAKPMTVQAGWPYPTHQAKYLKTQATCFMSACKGK